MTAAALPAVLLVALVVVVAVAAHDSFWGGVAWLFATRPGRRIGLGLALIVYALASAVVLVRTATPPRQQFEAYPTEAEVRP